MKKQVYNPFLPLNEYIPDGEPHIFDGRVYLYGSHDEEGGYTFCMNDYTAWSAPVDDLSDWRCEGIIYSAKQDPDYENRHFMYAPDVVRGNDGRYYLYYCMSGDFGVGGYYGPVCAAVCDTPAGKYEYLGFVRYPDGTPMKKYVCFDPAAINDNGTIRLYYGTQYLGESNDELRNDAEKLKTVTERFNKSAEEVLATEDNVNGPCTVTLMDDMLTVSDEPRHIIPYETKGTSFEGHEFFEASSMRKIGDKYYFIYSSQLNHELCYATSDYPDRDFVFGGTIVSNGDIGMNGRTAENRVNMTGTTHGSIIEINGQWYVFYHRLTHKSDYSRQACAERIDIAADGSIKQVGITSCGLNGGALRAEGCYPAVIACNITNGKMPHGSNSIYSDSFPNVNNDGDARFISDISDGTLIGFKYFGFAGPAELTVTLRGNGEGQLDICTSEDGPALAATDVSPCSAWTELSVTVPFQKGTAPLYLIYKGSGNIDIMTISFHGDL